ncbi:hypothetical protein, partial [uncultured Desulfovibrio sp.]|uniref:hypothetical protein n=1 Tax=uncultured Desulfovibrio sp. TaxID=167968 RepID=UPI002805DA34
LVAQSVECILTKDALYRLSYKGVLNEEDFYGKTPPGSSDFFIFCRGKFFSSAIYRNLLNKFEKGSWVGAPETTGRQRERQFLQGAGSWYGTRLAGKRSMSLIPQAIAAGGIGIRLEHGRPRRGGAWGTSA